PFLPAPNYPDPHSFPTRRSSDLDHVKLRILQIDPGEVALVVIVRKEGVSAKAKEVGKGFVFRKIGGFANSLRCRNQKLTISNVVCNRVKAIPITADYRVRT